MAPFDDILRNAVVNANIRSIAPVDLTGELAATPGRPSLLVVLVFNPQLIFAVNETVTSEDEVAVVLEDIHHRLSRTLPGFEQMTVRILRVDHRQLEAVRDCTADLEAKRKGAL